MVRVAAVAAVTVAVLLGCTSASTDTSETTAAVSQSVSTVTTRAPTTSIATTTTVADSTTTTAPPPTTTVPSTTTTTTMDALFSIATHGLHPEPLSGGGGWFGSGCNPGSDTLPDGIWWGYIKDLSASEIAFDLACLRWEDEADDDPESEDYAWVIENSNPKVRIVPAHSDTLVTCQWQYCPPIPMAYGEWIEDDRLPHGDWGREGGLWLYVNNGVVTEIGDEVLAG